MLLEKIIKINTVTNLNPQDPRPINFQDENKDKYSLWKSNKEGESVAYAKFKTLPYGGDGATIGICYEEEDKSFVNESGKTIAYKQRTVKIVKDPSEIKPQNQVPNVKTINHTTQQPISSPQPIYVPTVNSTRDFEAEARGKVRHGFAIEAFKLGMPLDNSVKKMISEWTDFVMNGEIKEEFDITKAVKQGNQENGDIVIDCPF